MPIRGLYIGRPMVAGCITMTIFATRALSKVFDWEWLQIFVNPVVVFVAFLIAGIVIMYPWLKGPKALILAPLMVIIISFFVYAYYILP